MEIVIENPVESPPPPPPPPPPLQPQISWNAPSLTTTSTPDASTVMTITIAENPTAPTYPPLRFSYREMYAVNPLPFAGDPYAARRGQPQGISYDAPEVVSPSVRRIDKSGLLGITDPEASGPRTGLRSPRFLSASNTPGLVSPRRFECIGQLDPVPEVPGQPTPPSGIPPVPWDPSMSMIARDREEPADYRDTLSVVSFGKPSKSASFESLESRPNDREMEGSSLQTFDRCLEGIEAPRQSTSFRLQEGPEARRPLGRLPRFPLARHELDSAQEGVPRYTETCCNFPFSVRSATAFPGFEGSMSLPSTRAATTTVTSSAVAVSAMRDAEQKQQLISAKRVGEEDQCQDRSVSGEERAEAEGCEHGPTEDGESSQRDGPLDNDAIQTLRVIILSEQL